MDKTELKIEGMHCVSCERTITKALKKVPGVEEVTVSFVSGKACIKGPASEHDLIRAIESTGYAAHSMHGKEDNDFKRQLITLILSALCTLPLLIQMVTDYLPLWVQWMLATIVQFGFGWGFYVESYWAIRTLTGNMDLLVCLGTSAAYFFSTAVFFFHLPAHLYFESSAMIITLILLGRYFESRSKRRDDVWREISIDEIKVGDLFQVRPGEKVPIDGEVIEGESYIDESLLTGESIPLSKTVGMPLIGGTDIAIESADITLMKNDIGSVASAISLAKATFRKIRQNLFFAFIYNILGIPLAAFGLLGPMIAAGAMALSSLCVVSNSLLLNRWKP